MVFAGGAGGILPGSRPNFDGGRGAGALADCSPTQPMFHQAGGMREDWPEYMGNTNGGGIVESENSDGGGFPGR